MFGAKAVASPTPIAMQGRGSKRLCCRWITRMTNFLWKVWGREQHGME